MPDDRARHEVHDPVDPAKAVGAACHRVALADRILQPERGPVATDSAGSGPARPGGPASSGGRRPRKWGRYCAIRWRYIPSPSLSASYSASQSSARKPLWTRRHGRGRLPWPRSRTRTRGASRPARDRRECAKRWGGSQAVTVEIRRLALAERRSRPGRPARLDLVAGGQEPAVDAGAGRDRVPDLSGWRRSRSPCGPRTDAPCQDSFRRRRAGRRAVGPWSTLGWMATIRRWSRPPRPASS